MAQAKQAERIERIAHEVLANLSAGKQITPFSARYSDFDLAEAYDIAARVRDLRAARGENSVGRKIGFTNRSVWSSYQISGPMWNYIFDSTVSNIADEHRMFSLAGLPEPRIEPEIALHLAAAPRPGMTEDELFDCVDWVAPAFEIVHSSFPGWKFTAADAVADCGVHSALLLGERRAVTEARGDWAKAISSFTVLLLGDDGTQRSGQAGNVLGGPMKALQFLVDEIARRPNCEPLRAGELVTTGTLTEAMPAAAGQKWSTVMHGIDLRGLRLGFR